MLQDKETKTGPIELINFYRPCLSFFDVFDL